MPGTVGGRILAAARRLLPGSGYVRHQGSVLPPPEKRWCGPEFKDDAFFLHSAEAEAERLREMGCGLGSRVLDVGCGYGRLPIGLLRVVGDVDYLGLDVHRGSIDWCRRHLERAHPSFRFAWMDRENERYNPGGGAIGEEFRLPVETGTIDVAYLYSVASHLPEAHLRIYLAELGRVLAPGGRIFLTAFVEEDVPPVAVNPPGYAFARCSGPLHVVRYERGHLASLLAAAGFRVDRFDPGAETDGQSGLYLSRQP
ncbi:MAG TPA: class I SAM-dependent methyltransferase [Longimicrobium sp.]|nr:class I SAM-dependent methyltransferase [Longimicrobium sp.]